MVGGLDVGFAGGVEALDGDMAGVAGAGVNDFNGLERQRGVTGDDVGLGYDVGFSGVVVEGEVGLGKIVGCALLQREGFEVAVEAFAVAGFDGEIGQRNAAEICGGEGRLERVFLDV